jgi:hypothetical protein
VLRSATAPYTVAEHYRMTQARLDGEARWARELVERLRSGAYWFEGGAQPAVEQAAPGACR